MAVKFGNRAGMNLYIFCNGNSSSKEELLSMFITITFQYRSQPLLSVLNGTLDEVLACSLKLWRTMHACSISKLSYWSVSWRRSLLLLKFCANFPRTRFLCITRKFNCTCVFMWYRHIIGDDGLQVPARTGASVPGCWLCACDVFAKPTTSPICWVRLPRYHRGKDHSGQ